MESLEELFCNQPVRGRQVTEAVIRLLKSMKIDGMDELLPQKPKDELIGMMAAQCGDYWMRVLDEAFTKNWKSKRHCEHLRLLAMHVALTSAEVFEKIPKHLAAMRKSHVFTDHGNFVRINAEAIKIIQKRCHSIRLSEWIKNPKLTLNDCYKWQKERKEREEIQSLREASLQGLSPDQKVERTNADGQKVGRIGTDGHCSNVNITSQKNEKKTRGESSTRQQFTKHEMDERQKESRVPQDDLLKKKSKKEKPKFLVSA
eukprot:scpid83985/ scgid1609/ 